MNNNNNILVNIKKSLNNYINSEIIKVEEVNITNKLLNSLPLVIKLKKEINILKNEVKNLKHINMILENSIEKYKNCKDSNNNKKNIKLIIKQTFESLIKFKKDLKKIL